jgi:hypothetical protein
MRASLVPALVLISLVLGVSSHAATGPGAIVESKSGKTLVFKGARCLDGRLYFGAKPNASGIKLAVVLLGGAQARGRVSVIDGFIDLGGPAGVHEGLSGTAFVNPDGKSGRINVWGRRGAGWESRTGRRWGGTWRCP